MKTVNNREFNETLTEKLRSQRAKQEELQALLNEQFDYDIFRQLSIINQKISVIIERKKGRWKKGTPLLFSIK